MKAGKPDGRAVRPKKTKPRGGRGNRVIHYIYQLASSRASRLQIVPACSTQGFKSCYNEHRSYRNRTWRCTEGPADSNLRGLAITKIAKKSRAP